MFAGMTDWLLTYHQVLEFRLLGLLLFVATFALGGAVVGTLRNALQQATRRRQIGIPIWLRHTR